MHGRSYLEQRASSVGADLQNHKHLIQFFDEIKKRHSVRKCPYVTQMAGIVMDDTGQHMKSYWYEWPALGSIERVLHLAEASMQATDPLVD